MFSMFSIIDVGGKMELIEFKNIYKTYKNGVTALCDVNVSIKKGQQYASHFYSRT